MFDVRNLILLMSAIADGAGACAGGSDGNRSAAWSDVAQAPVPLPIHRGDTR